MLPIRVLVMCGLGCVGLLGCDDSAPTGVGAAPGPSWEALPDDSREMPSSSARVSLARATAREVMDQSALAYRSWGLADRDLNWGPTMCVPPSPGRGWISASDDSATHGQKLYYMYAESVESYQALDDDADAVGQVLVKETWHPEPSEGRRGDAVDSRPVAVKDGVTYKPGAQGPLFIMARLDPDTPETDDGWVYGVVSPDRSIVAFGLIESCMECHQDANKGRLFGLPNRFE